MTYKIISILLTLIGSIGLFSSLFPTQHICKIDKKHCLRWKSLGALIMFFVIGYFIFIYMVSKGNGSLLQLEVALILCGGGIFVPLVIKMSVLSIDRIKKMSERILYRAGHDDLTDLPNRFALKAYMNEAILEATLESRPVSLLLLDIDRFKEINDALGHQHGDHLLQLTASRLNKCTRGADIVSRLGGDEFAVVLPGANLEQAIAASEKISREMEEPFSIEDYKVNIDLSIGISFFPEHGDDSETLLQRADVAMYTAKRSNTKFAVYDAEQDKYTMDRLRLTEDLREAIKEDHLVLHYQPKISAKDTKLCGVEALVRWNHTHKNLLYPDHFIALAEQTGLIRSLTLWVINNSLQQKAIWMEEGFNIPMAINISIKNLQDLEFPFQVKELLEKWQVDDPSSVTFEITESSMMLDPDRTYEVISNLHSMGLNISIDDFGTGYSSLAYLKQLPASEIKIDKSFVMDMLEDDNDAIIVRSIIDLANNMGLRIVAEGVENIKIFDFLSELGCEIMQGHHFCPAVPPDELLSKVNTMLPEMAAA